MMNFLFMLSSFEMGRMLLIINYECNIAKLAVSLEPKRAGSILILKDNKVLWYIGKNDSQP